MKHKPHPHAAALDRIGRQRILNHFNISTAAYSNWRVRGVPAIHRKTIAHLGVIHGVAVPEMAEGGL